MRVAFRADASVKIGTGHVYRCAALGERLRADGAKVVFLCRVLNGNMLSWLEENGFQTISLPEPLAGQIQGSSYADWLEVPQAQEAADSIAAIRNWGRPDWLVADHYALDRWWDRAMRPEVGRIMIADDLADRKRDADLLVNQNLGFSSETYVGKVPLTCRVLTGPRYAMLRPQFADARQTPRKSRSGLKNILISFGGIDAGNSTFLAIEGVIAAGLSDLTCDVLLGAANPHADVIRRKCSGLRNVRILQGVDDVASLMKRADLFCGSGGVITWERATLGLPGLTIAIAQNQVAGCVAMAEAGADIHLGSIDDVEPEHVATKLVALSRQPEKLLVMSLKAAAICDGQGASRISGHLCGARLHIRRATPDDCDAIFHWRNHPTIRTASGNTGVLDLDLHREWFKKILANPNRVLLIAEQSQSGDVIGVVRYDIAGDEATISIYLVPEYQGFGLGLPLLNQADRWLSDDRGHVRVVNAMVKLENLSSCRLFAQAGYREKEGRFIKCLKP